MAFFVDVILPLPIKGFYTYSVSEQQANFLKIGMRVFVTFGKSKNYTAIVVQVHQQTPKYKTKDIDYILDEFPVLTLIQIELLQWLSSYYMLPIGEILKVAIPSALLLESQTMIEKNQTKIETQLTDDEYFIVEALSNTTMLSVKEIAQILPKKKVASVLNSLVEKNIIKLSEKVYEKYKPKMVRYIKINSEYETQNGLNVLFENISSRATEQRKLIMGYFTIKSQNKNEISANELLEKTKVESSILSTLIKKGIFQQYYLQKDRVFFQSNQYIEANLTENQEYALNQINEQFEQKNTVLLHGVAFSGKTEIYIKQIKKMLDLGKQVLYLLPEISISVQLVERLKHIFGEQMSVYHSKYSINERMEVWNNMLKKTSSTQLIVGVKSAVFLPYTNLGLVIIDQEEDASYKYQDISMSFQCKDLALVLAAKHKAKTLLGSSTPSIESYYNVQTKKYGYVLLNQRYGNYLLPKIELIDIKDKTKRKRMTGSFSDMLIDEINQTLTQKKQVILFQNRRGYAPFIQCEICGDIPQCVQCDVSLTYHQATNQMRCHYCGYSQAVLTSCQACTSTELIKKGVGTEQIQQELEKLFPNVQIERMDKDTTQRKYAYQELIERFEQGKTEILVGTQMVGKGLDFHNVGLVGVINADLLIKQPDFRAIERSFQFLTQLAGRAGRSDFRGKVLIQTYNDKQSILKQVSDYQYDEMIKEQLSERELFHYPPYYRLIQIVFKHRDIYKINQGTSWFADMLRAGFKNTPIKILGAEFALIPRIRNEYIKHILIKIPIGQPITSVKKYIKNIEKSFLSISEYRSIHLIFNVDI